MSAEKYFITNRGGGLGDDMCNIQAVHFLAKKYGGSVILDWRILPYNNKATCKVNLIHSLFKIPNEIEGVKFYTFEEIPELSEVNDAFSRPQITNNISIADIDKLVSEYNFINVCLRTGGCESNSYKEFKCENYILENYLSFWSNFELQNSIKTKLDYYRSKYFSAGNVIGIHIRHGNGETPAPKPPNWYSHNSVKQKINEILKIEYPNGIDNKQFFICADNKNCTYDFLKSYPTAFSTEKTFSEDGEGALHMTCRNPISTIQEAFVDMELLSNCELGILTICSVFNLWAGLKLKRSYYYDGDRYFKSKHLYSGNDGV